jgi:hypothetical protein
MLRSVGRRNLRTDEISDASGQLRVIFRTPNWEDFVHLAFSEIRACGANNLQIVRRLRAMIENLKETLPDYRFPDFRRVPLTGIEFTWPACGSDVKFAPQQTCCSDIGSSSGSD